MPATFDIRPEERRVVITLSGTLSIVDVEELTNSLRASPGFDPNFDFYTDARGVKFAIEPREVMEFAGFYCKHLASKTGRSALVLGTPRETSLGLVHKHAVQHGRTVEIFHTEEAALEWLNR